MTESNSGGTDRNVPDQNVVFTRRGPGSYTTGGFYVGLGFMRKAVESGVIQIAGGAYVAECPEDAISGLATQVLVRDLSNNGAEVANTTNLSGLVCRLIVKGY
tara:strand:- start:4629 stop:4937 length:309 start_codon:yes stop_codon:yes gene_type:complete